MILNNDDISDNFIVGVIAATPFDTNLGVKLLEKKTIKAMGLPLSDTPQQQTYLQIHKDKLVDKLEKAIRFLVFEKNVNCIFIYCNSLSASLDLGTLQKKFSTPIITPLSFYQKIAKNFNFFALLAANDQSVSNIERILLNHNPCSVMIGLGNLLLVNAVEEGMKAKTIIEHFRLVDQVSIFKQQGCECLLLGCTHFTCFFDELVAAIALEKISINIFDSSMDMVSEVLALKNARSDLKNSKHIKSFA